MTRPKHTSEQEYLGQALKLKLTHSYLVHSLPRLVCECKLIAICQVGRSWGKIRRWFSAEVERLIMFLVSLSEGRADVGWRRKLRT